MKSQIPLPPRIADIAASELEKRILEGSLRPGDRLPSERDLSVEMAVSRPSLREAIHRLVSDWRQHDKYVFSPVTVTYRFWL